MRLATRGAGLRAEPSECFARFAGGDRWIALEHGGAIHWLAHKLGLRAPAGGPCCAAGLALQADALLGAHRPFSGPPRPGDLWLDLDGASCGLIESVAADPQRGLAISIRRLRSTPARVCVEDFHFQLHGRGRFLR